MTDIRNSEGVKLHPVSDLPNSKTRFYLVEGEWRLDIDTRETPEKMEELIAIYRRIHGEKAA